MFEHSRRRNSDRTDTSSTPADRKDADARYADEVASAWNSLDDEAQADLLTAAAKLKQVHEKLDVTTVFRCHRGTAPSPLRTAADIRAEVAMLRADRPPDH